MTSALALNPIPSLPGVDGREIVPIHECNEPLVSVSRLAPRRLRVLPEYYLRGYVAASLESFVRVAVGEMLVRAAELLPSPYRLVVLDGWRSLDLQRELFDEALDAQRLLAPFATERVLESRTSMYVSVPSESADRPPPHLTGGAVDVTFQDEHGRPAEMGTSFDHFGPEAAVRFFEEQVEGEAALTDVQREALDNRRRLYHAMTSVGFSSYREEWWHFDYGDQFWGCVNKTDAIYGSTRPS